MNQFQERTATRPDYERFSSAFASLTSSHIHGQERVDDNKTYLAHH